ncbi:hypothetical protein DPMN_079795 [Dreissena polymorpha]|uniref:Uncharacterized protein n=1 Tax=Dreissena polymorpha TaxID=45954 RepID=A0A9D4BQE6_DREPO|nr:hypothetical protein DPMN_079795 [Dreissena polymorpha]
MRHLLVSWAGQQHYTFSTCSCWVDAPLGRSRVAAIIPSHPRNYRTLYKLKRYNLYAFATLAASASLVLSPITWTYHSVLDEDQAPQYIVFSQTPTICQDISLISSAETALNGEN